MQEVDHLNIVIGSAGFVGQNLVEVLTSLDPDTPILRVDINEPCDFRIDISNTSDVGKLKEILTADSVVYFLSAISTNALCIDNPSLARSVNLSGLIAVLEACASAGIKKFVFASSEWVYENMSPNQLLISEESLSQSTLPHQLYASTKFEGEQLVACYNSVFETCIGRFGIIYGPKETNRCALDSFVYSALAGTTINIGAPSAGRNFIFIDDLCRALIFIGKPGGRIGIYNITHPEYVTLEDAADALLKLNLVTAEQVILGEAESKVRCVVPQRLIDEGFCFEFDLRAGLLEMFKRVSNER